jgi:hypothetical protein
MGKWGKIPGTQVQHFCGDPVRHRSASFETALAGPPQDEE